MILKTQERYDIGVGRIHNAKNASDSSAAEFVAVVIKPAGFVGPAFRPDQAQPNN